MKHCPHCNIDVNTERKTCPLCFHLLEEEEKASFYQPYHPYERPPRSQEIFMRIVLYLVIVAIISSTVVNLATLGQTTVVKWWSFMVDVSALYTYFFITTMIKGKRNMAVRFLLQIFLLSFLLIVINLVLRTKNQPLWSLTYVIPSCITSALIVTVLMSFIKPALYREYLPSMVLMSLLSVIPLILYFTTSHLMDKMWPSIMACSTGFLVILGIFIFPRRMTQEEIRKRFHM